MDVKSRALSLFLAAALLCALWPTPVAAVEFPDVPPSHWAYAYITQAADDGAVNGYSNGEFRPGAPLTLAHFLSMLVRTLYAEELEALEMDDSAPWYEPLQVIGEQHDLFWKVNANMNDPLSRYDMATILFSVLVDEEVDWSPSETEIEQIAQSITDYDDFPSTTLQQVVPIIYATEILTGYSDGSFGGNEILTRAAAAAVYCRLKAFLEEYGGETPSDGVSPEDLLIEQLQRELMDEVNTMRAEMDLSPLTVSESLNRAAQIRASEITVSLSDTRPDGSDWRTVLSETGVSCTQAGEYFTDDIDDDADTLAVLSLILDPSYTRIGFGFVFKNDKTYLVILCADSSPSSADTPSAPVEPFVVPNPDEPPPDFQNDPEQTQMLLDELLMYFNLIRTYIGLDELSLSTELCAAAQIRATEIAQGYTSVRPDGRDWDTVLEDVGITSGYGVVGEAYSVLDFESDEFPSDLLSAIMDEDYNKVGFGVELLDSGNILLVLVLTQS